MPLIRDDDIDEVRTRADIVDVISAQVALKKAGRLYKGLCPFHNEKTPSFFVNPERQTFHCFGCNEGGNVITYVMKTENLDFPEAVKALADRVGFMLRYEEGSTVRREPEGKKTRVYAVNVAAREFFVGNLAKTAEGKKGLEYLKARGFGGETTEKFGLGYAPDAWEAFAGYAAKKDFKQAELLDAGLVIKSDKQPGRVYDRFRGRVIFPIMDLQDRVIGFGGRVIGDGTPKYLNSPETPVFHKSHALYALNWAKDVIKQENEAVVVEGYTDVIAMMIGGIGNVVATLGTALGAEHLKLLARYTNRVVFVFDADEAGRKAAERGLELMRDFYVGPEFRKFSELAADRRLDLFVATLPPGLDPADYIGKEGGEACKGLIADAVPLVDFCIAAVFAGADIRTASGKQKTAGRALEIIALLPSEVAREEYLKSIAERLSVTYETLFGEFEKIKRRREGTGRREVQAPPAGRDPTMKAEREVLKLMLQFPDQGKKLASKLSSDCFSHEDLRDTFEFLQRELEERGSIEASAIIARLPEDAAKKAIASLTTEEILAGKVDIAMKDLVKRLKESAIARRINTLKAEMKQLDSKTDAAKHNELFERMLKLEAERREIQRAHGG